MPADEKAPEKSGRWTLERVLALLNILALLGNMSAAGLLFWFYGLDELAHKRRERETELKPHVKHDFSTKVYTVKAPTKEAFGLFRVSFAGRITNGGKFAFKCGEDGLVTAHAQLDSAKLRAPMAVLVNIPGEPGPLLWQNSETKRGIGQINNSLLQPGEEATIEVDFLVVGTYDTHLAIYYTFPIWRDTDKREDGTIPWSHFEVVSLASAKKNDSDDNKAKETK